jgi:hydrogenase maturation protein HypF
MPATPQERRHFSLRGRVQGVGMRPFLCRLAGELGLTGWVGNAPEGVTVEVEGDAETLARFELRLRRDAPPQARIVECIAASIPAIGNEPGFRVVGSLTSGAPAPCTPPDLATCPACLRELFDPTNRRYRHPFISCCDCGPRYSILRALPFDRERTAMADFPLCPACQQEYGAPHDRRFHAQTLCCPHCGPRLAWLRPDGKTHATGNAALERAVVTLRGGGIVALQGVGGFQLLADAGSEGAVARLRQRKQRPDKPFAVLADEAMIRALCEISPTEREWLQSPAAPIVLLDRKCASGTVSDEVAPALPWLGVMLPASPLHHLLLADFGAPLVATSGNRSEEPICINPKEALSRLGGIADGFLVHDRPILRPLDDSVLRIAAGRPLLLRRARGFVPEPIELTEPIPPLLAVGGHLKNTVALAAGRQAILSQHLGDLDDALTQRQYRTTLAELPALFGIQPQAVACDKHPDYASTRLAESGDLPLVRVAHHYAHALACMAEHGLKPPLLALAWDGLGLGEDGTLWGGEFLVIERQGYRRIASFLPLPLPGGEKAVREPRRAALAALHGIYGGDCLEHMPKTLQGAFTPQEPALFLGMLERQLNTPPCSSVGRLFDAVSALLGLCFVNRFEGQAAMLLEAAAQTSDGECAFSFALNTAGLNDGALVSVPPPTGEDRWGRSKTAAADLLALPHPNLPPKGEGTGKSRPELHSTALSFTLLPGDPLRVDWRPLLEEILAEQSRGVPANRLAARSHATLTEIALHIAALAGYPNVVLCGGCFQNRLLLEGCATRLRQAGYGVHWPQRIPPNDGGLALGQLLGAARQLREP